MKIPISHFSILILALLFFGCNSSATQKQNDTSPLTAQVIMQKAHDRAGGSFWSKPKSLTMKGYGLFYENGKTNKNEIHNMWRVYESEKENAHTANGKVRIESFRDSKPVFIVTYDGENTYDLRGKQEKSEADKRWASNFGYGVIRHAFDPGYTLEKLEDGEIKKESTYRIKVKDPDGGETIFDINQNNFNIVGVAFDTPRGWHERHYSQFFTKDQYSWLQPGLVELYYKGEKANDIIWEDFDVNQDLPDSLFVLN